MVKGWDNVRVGMTVEYAWEHVTGYVGEVGENYFYIWQDDKAGVAGSIRPSTKGFRYSWQVNRDWSGEVVILSGVKETQRKKEKGGSMESYISKVFEKTEDALLVEKHITKGSNFIIELTYKANRDAILEEAKRLEEEERKEEEKSS